MVDEETDTDEILITDSGNIDDEGEDIFEEFNKMSEIKVAALLRETENKLYRTFELGVNEDVEANDIKTSRRNILERRHNFETYNRPQSNHITPKFSEWTTQFTYLRVCGEQIALQPMDLSIDFEEDERYAVDTTSAHAEHENLVIDGRRISGLYKPNTSKEEVFASHGVEEQIIEINYHDEESSVSQDSIAAFDPMPSTEMGAVEAEMREEALQFMWKTIVPTLSSIVRHIAKCSIAEKVHEIRAHSAPVGSAARLCFSRTKRSIERKRNLLNRFKSGGGTPQPRIKQNSKIGASATTPTTIKEMQIKHRFRMYSPQKNSTIKPRITKKEA